MPSSKFSADSLPDLKGRVYLVTGGNAGIGKVTVIGLATHGAKVYMGARSESKALATIQEIKQELPEADIQFLYMDLTSLATVVAAARTLKKHEVVLHGLINNAGIMAVPYTVTGDGYESQFQTNYLSHWLLTQHLLPLLTAAASTEGPGAARIVNVTSDGHERFQLKDGIRFDDINLESETPFLRYGQSKLGNILHAKELHRRYGPTAGSDKTGEIWAVAVHPGHIDTDLNKQATGTASPGVLRAMTKVMRCVGILDEQAKGALSSLFAIASPDFQRSDSGAYVVPYAKIGKPSAMSEDAALASKLWEWTAGELAKRGLLEA